MPEASCGIWELKNLKCPTYLRHELQKDVGSAIFTKSTKNTFCQMLPTRLTYAPVHNRCPVKVRTVLILCMQ